MTDIRIDIGRSSRGREAGWPHAAIACVLLAVGVMSASATPTDAAPASQIRLEGEALTRAGIEFVRAKPMQFTHDARGYGRVLDPSPIGDAVAGQQAARALEAAASADLVRVTELERDHQNASLRELQTAHAAAARASADLAIATGRVVALLGNTLAQDPELPVIARRLTTREAALVRIDIPGREARPAPELGVTLMTYPATPNPISARYVGVAPDVAPALPGWGFLFLVVNDAPPPGTSVVARIRGAGDAISGVVVPCSALVHHARQTFAFVSAESGLFDRTPVESIRLEDGACFVSRGLATGDQVVVRGAQQLLSSQVFGSGAEAGP